jgi:hypothetical protein
MDPTLYAPWRPYVGCPTKRTSRRERIADREDEEANRPADEGSQEML